jgi:hypothetical protein
MTAVGVAAVAAFEVIGRREDEIWAFVIKVFGEEFGSGGVRSFFYIWVRGGLGGVQHC